MTERTARITEPYKRAILELVAEALDSHDEPIMPNWMLHRSHAEILRAAAHASPPQAEQTSGFEGDDTSHDIPVAYSATERDRSAGESRIRAVLRRALRAEDEVARVRSVLSAALAQLQQPQDGE